MPETTLSAAEVERLRSAPLTYDDVGATAAVMPPGYHHLRMVRPLGAGREVFESAAAVVTAWDMHRGAGLEVRASGDATREGAVAVLGIGWGPLRVHAPVRVVRVVDEPGRRGFVYGTLPGHPESGEESFVVEIDAEEQVRMTVRAFSRPGTLPARIAGPLGRLAQRRISDAYLDAVERG